MFRSCYTAPNSVNAKLPGVGGRDKGVNPYVRQNEKMNCTLDSKTPARHRRQVKHHPKIYCRRFKGALLLDKLVRLSSLLIRLRLVIYYFFFFYLFFIIYYDIHSRCYYTRQSFEPKLSSFKTVKFYQEFA